MRNRFDHLAKQIGQRALGRSGTIVVHDEISPETQHADLRHEPDPARSAERQRLGLLGRLATVACLIEIYGHTPSADEFRACLLKHLAWWQQRARRQRADHKKRTTRRASPRASIEPFLWIIAAGAPVSILTRLRLEAAPGWPAGVYFFGDDVLRVGIVVASELPRERSTLLVRLMAAGPQMRHAIEDLRTLPADAPERIVAEQPVLTLRYALGQTSNRTRQEQEFIVTMFKTWEDARTEGETKGQALSLLTILRVRGIAVSAAARKRILAQKSPKQLERWLEKAGVAASIEDVLGTGASAVGVRNASRRPRPGATPHVDGAKTRSRRAS